MIIIILDIELFLKFNLTHYIFFDYEYLVILSSDISGAPVTWHVLHSSIEKRNIECNRCESKTSKEDKG